MRARVFARHATGTITDNPLAAGATTINSAEFADLPAVDAHGRIDITLDPGGANERAVITAHTAAATSVTVSRAAGVEHATGVTWIASVYEDDLLHGLDSMLIPAGGADDVVFNRQGATTLPSGFSWVNQGSATYLEKHGAGVIRAPGAGASHSHNLIVKTLPASGLIIARTVSAFQYGIAAYYDNLVIRESSTGRLLSFGYSYQYLHIGQWLNPTTFSAWVNGPENLLMCDFQYFRIVRNSSTDWAFAASPDGRAWYETISGHNPTTFMSGSGPDQVGFGLSAGPMASTKAGAVACYGLRFE